MRLIDADELLKQIDVERKYLIERGQIGAEHILVHNFRDLVLNAPTVESNRWVPFETRESDEDSLVKEAKMTSIDDLHEELKQIHKNYFPRMRFGHFISGFMSWVRLETGGRRILFLDDVEVLECINDMYHHLSKISDESCG